MTILAVSDVVWTGLITNAALIVLAIIGHRAARIAKLAATKVDQVKQDLSENTIAANTKLNSIKTTEQAKMGGNPA